MTVSHAAPTLGHNTYAQPRVISVEEATDGASSGRYRVAPEVCDEVAQLQQEGYDVQLTDVPDPHALPEDQQREITAYLAHLEQSPNGPKLFRQPEALGVWSLLTMRAIALEPLYNASSAETLGGVIGSDAYDTPLFRARVDFGGGPSGIAMLTANDVVRAQMAVKGEGEKAEEIIAAYRTFVETPIDDESRLAFQGAADSSGVRRRGYQAGALAVEHFADPDGRIRREGLNVLSVACGAATPTAQNLKEFEEHGADIKSFHAVDLDPMALASAHASSARFGMQDKIKLYLRNLRDPITDYIAKGSIDYSEGLGIIEYFKAGMAARLLRAMREVGAPGSFSVFGNMLDIRPEQNTLNAIVKWPEMQQRSIRKTLNMCAAGGYDPHTQVRARIPANEGVYAVYGLTIPGEGNDGVYATTDPAGRNSRPTLIAA